MKNNAENYRINLHIGIRRTLLTAVFFATGLIIFNIIFGFATNTYCSQLDALICSNYEYSAVTIHPVEEDGYYFFDAGLYFSDSIEMCSAINSEVVMQSSCSNYSKKLSWNSKPLNMDEIAISKGIARRYNLTIGDKLYSKHIVDGEKIQYSIKQIIPEIVTIRVSEANINTGGVIIMGEDRSYLENISHRFVLFTNSPVDELTKKLGETPTDIIYRNDEKLAVLLGVIPYWITFALLGMGLSAMIILVLSQEIRCSFRRQVILGVRENALNLAYYKFLLYAVVMPFAANVLISLLVIKISLGCSVVMTSICFFSAIELMIQYIIMHICRLRLWRE